MMNPEDSADSMKQELGTNRYGSRKRFVFLKGTLRDNAIRLTFFTGTSFFESEKGRDMEAVRIYRAEADGFEFGVDYQEYFDGMACRDAELLFEGALPTLNGRKCEYGDSTVRIGKVYAYWVAPNGKGNAATGPVLIKARDQEVWWPQSRLETELATLEKQHRGVVTVRVFGETVNGFPIKGLFAGNRDRRIAFVGAIHAGESGPELMIPCLARLLAEQPGLIDKCGVAMMPSVNIDERERMATGHPSYLRTNSRGVDINRNFAADWDQVCYDYGLISTDPDAVTYRGRAPASEPETKAVTDFLKEARPIATLSFHALASLCDANFLAPKASDGDAPFLEEGRRIATLYARGMYPDSNAVSLHCGSSFGSLPHWLYKTMRAPGFDLEVLPDKETFKHIHDTTTFEVLKLYQERHYNGILSLLSGLALEKRNIT